MHLGSPLASWGGYVENKKPMPSHSCQVSSATTSTLAGCTSASGGGNGSAISCAETSNKTQPFASWFLWCQTCRHGGHSSHLLHWFDEHPECPVTGCTCRCLNLDSIGHQIPVIANGHEWSVIEVSSADGQSRIKSISVIGFYDRLWNSLVLARYWVKKLQSVDVFVPYTLTP